MVTAARHRRGQAQQRARFTVVGDGGHVENIAVERKARRLPARDCQRRVGRAIGCDAMQAPVARLRDPRAAFVVERETVGFTARYLGGLDGRARTEPMYCTAVVVTEPE